MNGARARALAVVVFSFFVVSIPAAFPSPVAPGSQQLLQSPYAEKIAGKRLGILAHQASRNAAGKHIVDLLFETPGLQLTTIFAPEHGFRGTEDSHLPDSVDPVTKLPVYSLYGPRSAPTPELLARIDVLIIDLQDVGMRYYTYGATMALSMKAAKESGKPVIILDRPNPIGGMVVEGPVLEKDLINGIAAFASIPSRHGLTLGGLALLYNEMLGIGADLTVVPMKGWSRDLYWDQTGLPWIGPSPALPEFDQAFLYGVFGTLETVNIAVGRGKTNELGFRVYGAPWITPPESVKLAAALNRAALPGLRFSAVEWLSTREAYAGQKCRGFRVEITDRAQVDGFRSLVTVMSTFKRVFGKRADISKSDAMLGSTWVRKAIESGTGYAAILDHVEKASSSFKTERMKHLIYP